MIVRQFINWIRSAPAGERAEATRALARAWLISDLTEEDRTAAEGALLMLLDDEMQCAIARRINLPASVCAAIAEVGTPAAALELIENAYAELAPF